MRPGKPISQATSVRRLDSHGCQGQTCGCEYKKIGGAGVCAPPDTLTLIASRLEYRSSRISYLVSRVLAMLPSGRNRRYDPEQCQNSPRGRVRMTRTPFPATVVVCCLSLTGVVLYGTPAAQARVTQVVIAKTESPT